MASLLTTAIPAASQIGTFWYEQADRRALADDLVAFVDDVVESGSERSRAAVVTRALERERRRVIAARDAEILARTGPHPEFEALAEHVVARPAALD